MLSETSTSKVSGGIVISIEARARSSNLLNLVREEAVLVVVI